MDWEQWLKNAARRPSDSEDSRRQKTEDEIRAALAGYAPLRGKPYVVYAKGSYANNTNVRLNYDVDVAVEYTGYFYYDFVLDAEGYGPTEAGFSMSSDSYTRDDFKADIKGALDKAFGASSIEVGKIALRVREKKTTLPADVVPCWSYRRYDTIQNGRPIYQEGSRVYPSSGSHKDNFPKRQVTRGTKKNTNTGRRYKRMVRALKKLQTVMVSEGLLEKELASYFTECLVFNVPDSYFNHTTYLADMRAVIACIFNATLNAGDYAEWEEVHGLRYLFGGDFSRSDAHAMVSAAWDYLGFE